MNNRIIKFRVWDSSAKRYLMDGEYVIDAQGGVYYLGNNAGNLSLSRELAVDCVIQQFTGVKDKNSADIYEGDIIKYNPFNQKDYKNTIVPVYDLTAFHWWHELENMIFNHRNKCNLQVIGNIYENPELLKL
jgi:uncharacterized phage protein (TIGR01671 family)